MIKSVDFPDKSFATKEELFDALRESQKILIDAKKSVVYKSVDKGCSISLKPLNAERLDVAEKSFKYDENYWYLVMNTTNILDSHKDLHVDGIWNKSIKERQNKNYIVDSHELSVKSTIARKEHVELILYNTTFQKLGLNYNGSTQALVYKVPKDKIIDEKAQKWLESGDEIQGSVRMQYVDIQLAMNSKNDSDKENKALYDAYEPLISNKSEFKDEIYYFWVVKQAKNVMESSLVPFGSNPITGNLLETKEENDIEPLENTQIENKETAVNLDTVRKALQETLKFN